MHGWGRRGTDYEKFSHQWKKMHNKIGKVAARNICIMETEEYHCWRYSSLWLSNSDCLLGVCWTANWISPVLIKLRFQLILNTDCSVKWNAWLKKVSLTLASKQTSRKETVLSPKAFKRYSKPIKKKWIKSPCLHSYTVQTKLKCKSLTLVSSMQKPEKRKEQVAKISRWVDGAEIINSERNFTTSKDIERLNRRQNTLKQ